MTDCKIERSNGRCFGHQQLHRKFHFIWETKPIFTEQNIQIIEPFRRSFLTVDLSQRCRWGSTFFQASRSRPAATADDYDPKCQVFVLARPTRPRPPPKLCQTAAPTACSQTLRLSSGIACRSDCQMTCRGSNLDLDLNSATWPKGCKSFICSETPESF